MLCPIWPVSIVDVSDMTSFYCWCVRYDQFLLLMCPIWPVSIVGVSDMTNFYCWCVRYDKFLLLLCPIWPVSIADVFDMTSFYSVKPTDTWMYLRVPLENHDQFELFRKDFFRHYKPIDRTDTEMADCSHSSKVTFWSSNPVFISALQLLHSAPRRTNSEQQHKLLSVQQNVCVRCIKWRGRFDVHVTN